MYPGERKRGKASLTVRPTAIAVADHVDLVVEVVFELFDVAAVGKEAGDAGDDDVLLHRHPARQTRRRDDDVGRRRRRRAPAVAAGSRRPRRRPLAALLVALRRRVVALRVRRHREELNCNNELTCLINLLINLLN